MSLDTTKVGSFKISRRLTEMRRKVEGHPRAFILDLEKLEEGNFEVEKEAFPYGVPAQDQAYAAVTRIAVMLQDSNLRMDFKPIPKGRTPRGQGEESAEVSKSDRQHPLCPLLRSAAHRISYARLQCTPDQEVQSTELYNLADRLTKLAYSDAACSVDSDFSQVLAVVNEVLDHLEGKNLSA